MSNDHDSTASDPLEGTGYEGIDRIEQALPRRWPGFTKRAKRVREWAHLSTLRIKREHPELSDREIQQRAPTTISTRSTGAPTSRRCSSSSRPRPRPRPRQ